MPSESEPTQLERAKGSSEPLTSRFTSLFRPRVQDMIDGNREPDVTALPISERRQVRRGRKKADLGRVIPKSACICVRICIYTVLQIGTLWILTILNWI